MIRKYAEIFCWKNVSSFCSAKATNIFSAKNIRIMYIESTKTVNEMTLNKLVKLTTLWTTGSRMYKLQLKYVVVLLVVLVLAHLSKSSGWAIVITLCPSSIVVHCSSSTISLLTLKRSQFWPSLDETCPECLPLWNLGQVRYWVTWGKKLGHQVKSKEKLVNTLEVTFLKQSSWILLKMFALMSSRSGLKLGHLGLKIRTPGQIKGKPC